MPTETEKRVLNLLSSTDLPPGTDPGKLIESWGNEAVTVACEIAMGSYPGLQRKIRTNAVAMLETVDRTQARETIALLVSDPNPDVAIRALRAAAGQKNAAVVGSLRRLLQSPWSSPLVAAETVQALIAIGTPEARQTLNEYESVNPVIVPHRADELVTRFLRERQN
jgi:hypothetical protein